MSRIYHLYHLGVRIIESKRLKPTYQSNLILIKFGECSKLDWLVFEKTNQILDQFGKPKTNQANLASLENDTCYHVICYYYTLKVINICLIARYCCYI